MAACAAMVGLGASAQLTNGTVYWIQDASTGQFISQGANWGTQATVQDVGGLGFEAAYVSEGVYKLKNIMWNKVNNADVGLRVTDGYCDQPASEVTLTASGEGYLVGIAGGNYLCNNQEENSYGVKPIGLSTNSTDATVWKFLTKEQYDAAIQAYKDKQAATFATSLGYTATSVSALEDILTANFITKDYTSGITNAALNAGNTNGWTATKPNQRAQAFGSENGTCAESWNGCVVATQTVSDLPNGLYKVTFVGTFRPKGNTDSEKLTSEQTSSPAYVFANDAKEEFIHWIDVDAKANNRTDIKNNASSYTSSFYTYVTDGSLKLGVKQDTWYGGNSWCPFGYFTLTYYSDQVSDDDATAILNTANGIKDSKMGSGVKSALTSAINTFNDNKTIANYNALNTAISDANASIASYEALQAAITNANNNTIYKTVFAASTEAYNNAVSTARGVYDAAEVDDCTAAITALTDGIHGAYENDYTVFANEYPYDYSTLLDQDMTKWASTDYVTMTANEHWNGKTGQKYYEQSGAEWGQNAWSHAASETATLPAGKYVMSITARASAGVTSTMSVKVGDAEAVTVALPNKGASGFGITTDGVGSYSTGTYANGNNGYGWEYRFIEFEVANNDTPVTISFSSSTSAAHNWVSIASPLLKGNVHPNQIKVNQAKALATTLAGYDSQITAETYATFANDITAANAATVESENLDDIISALQADIETAKAEIAAFERGAAMNGLNTGANSIVLSDEATDTNWTPTPAKNTWSTEADNTGMVKPFLQNWIAKENGTLSDNSLTYVPIRGLNKGFYKVSALVRVYAESGNEPSATSATFTVNGTSINLLEGTSFEYNDMKGVYQTVSITKEIEDALNIGLAYSGANFNWIAWKNLTVTYLGTDEANADDYDALNSAITAAEANTIGFEAEEFAPYNNVAALQALAAAKAIDVNAFNEKTIVNDATKALTDATWTANDEEVNAIYDGTFAAATNNGAPLGWTMSNNTLGGELHSRAFVGDARLSEFNETNSGFYIRFDGTNSNRGSMYYYGNTEGYTMPLKADTYYLATVDFAGWGSTGKPLRMNVTGPEGFTAVGQTINTSVRADNADNTPQQFNILFKTAGAGNYVINFQTPGADTNTHAVLISNVMLKKALEDVTITSAGYATYCSEYPLDFSNVTGLTAYTAEVDGTEVSFTEVNGAIPANTGVLLKGAAGTYSIPVASSSSEVTSALEGVIEETVVESEGIFVLLNGDNGVGFYKTTATSFTVGAHTAYFPALTADPSRKFIAIDEATAIKAIEKAERQNGEIYNLAGQRVKSAQKGLYIIGGKKVIK